ncbi:MAG: NifB/NifX family molybdenum-iron cluster-binding protein [Desulfuromonadaceae bacterium]
MNATTDSATTVRIAVPCYGDRVLPRFGQSREFYLAEVDLAAGDLHDLKRCSWDRLDEPQLVRWLRCKGVDAVFCGGIHPRFQADLRAGGIAVIWGFRGPVEEILRQWLQRREPLPNPDDDGLFESGRCRLRRGMGSGWPERDGDNK